MEASTLQCNNGSSHVPCGDPPIPYPGTTWIPGGYPNSSTFDPYRTGDWPPQYPYIGDPIVPYEPPIKVIPGKVEIIPTIGPSTNPDWWKQLQPNPGLGGITLMPNPWRATHLAEKSVFSCDVPGCRPEDVKVQISDRELSVTATRHDGLGTSSFSTAIDISFYDVKEAKAIVADGVVSVEVPYRDKSLVQPFQVPVSGK